ncbi:radical SAM enzyme, Cfr family protein [Zychaea mexicana]|uniref:radical SAM enzyme, Cfr family protein n=1 Tax=Zychaea mexicana TaxID=64656 RepID=UPI0022FF2D34|nr:radical SAM enzyme, Cfr family protein [Zychaea mexicana]KAI9495992.1 radical SAM enzyme, Cfr family protein [Zychaea mexicana]
MIVRHAKKNLIGLTLEQVKHELQAAPTVKPYTALQIWQHMYRHGSTSFRTMTNLPTTLRDHLHSHYTLDYGHVQSDQTSVDGTRKWLVGFNDPRAVVESVLIPEPKRHTLCVSSQIGCSLRCSFCHTGTQKLLRNLTAGEIVGQVMLAAHGVRQFEQQGQNSITRKKLLSHMVFMGQGEPLYNPRQVFQAIQVLTDRQGLQWPKQKITVSTSGVVPLIPKISELGVALAISLHATRNSLRDVLVPLNKTFPMETLMDACTQYARDSNGQRITFEYVMLDGVNDSMGEARDLVKLLKQLPAHVNLIPFNPWPGSIYKTSKPEQVERFAETVQNGGIYCTVRRPRGQDILAACGQLRSSEERKRATAAAAAL